MRNRVLNWMLSAFDTTTVGGASARKLSAWWMVMLVSALELTYTINKLIHDKDLTYLPEMIYADLAFAAAALGMTLYDKYQKNKVDQSQPSTGDVK